MKVFKITLKITCKTRYRVLENKDNIEILKEVLYEESTRKMLLEQQDILLTNVTAKPSFARWKILVAASIIGIVSLIGFNMFNGGSEDKVLMASRLHEFPVITKSRSAQLNIVDSHLDEINQGRYGNVLPLLDKENLSEKDKFVKTLLLFRTGKLTEAKQLISQTQWEDSYHQRELDWVLYLIAYSLDEPLDQLENKLSAEYRLKASKLKNR